MRSVSAEACDPKEKDQQASSNQSTKKTTSETELTTLPKEERERLYDLIHDFNAVFRLKKEIVEKGRSQGRRVPGHMLLVHFWLLPDGPFDQLRKLLLSLQLRPHLRLVREREWALPLEADEVDIEDTAALTAWRRGQSAMLPALQTRLTTDTPEHQAIRSFLLRLLNLLVAYRTEVSESDSEDEHLERADRRKRQVRQLLHLPLFNGVRRGRWPDVPTGVFLHDPMYRRLYDLMMSLERMPQAEPKTQKLLLFVFTHERWRLFELWCLFRTRDALNKWLKKKDPKTSEIRDQWFDEEWGLGLSGKGAPESTKTLKWTDGTKLYYQLKCNPPRKDTDYSSFALKLIPDIVIEHGDWHIVLDPKRVRADELGHGQSQETDPRNRPLRPWHQAHVYKDSILRKGVRPKASLLLVPKELGKPAADVRYLFKRWREYGFGGVLLGSKDKAIDTLSGVLQEVFDAQK